MSPCGLLQRGAFYHHRMESQEYRCNSIKSYVPANEARIGTLYVSELLPVAHRFDSGSQTPGPQGSVNPY